MLEIIRDIPRLEAIAEAWNEIAPHNPVPMLSHDWNVAAAKVFDNEIAVFALWDGPRLRAVAPFALVRSGYSRRLQFLARDIQEPDSLLFRDQQSLADLIAALTRSGWAFALCGLPVGGEEEIALRDSRMGNLSLFGRIHFSHSALLPATATALDEAISKSARTMLRRKLKQAEKFGSVEFIAETLDADNWKRFFDELIRVEGSGWKRENGTSLMDNPQQRAFYECYIQRKFAKETLRGYRMVISGQTVAIRLAEMIEDKLYELKIGYDDAFRACSPGMTLTHETLKAAIAEGVSVHEFLGGAEDWQKHWPLRVNEHVTVRRYPIGMNGMMNLGMDVFDKVGSRLQTIGKARLAAAG